MTIEELRASLKGVSMKSILKAMAGKGGSGDSSSSSDDSSDDSSNNWSGEKAAGTATGDSSNDDSSNDADADASENDSDDENMAKSIEELLKEDPDGDGDVDYQTFNEVFAESGAADQAAELVGDIDMMVAALHRSIASIMQETTGADKGALIQTTLDQFKDAINGLGVQGITKSFAIGLVTGSLTNSGAAPEPDAGGSGDGDTDMTKHAGAASAEAIKKTIDEAVAKGVAEAIAKVKADGDAALKVVTDQLAASTAAVTKMQDDTEIEQFRKEALDLGKPAEFGETLRALKKTSPTAYEALVKDAKSTAAVLKKSGMFSEIGATGSGETSALASLEAAADVIRKADTKLSKAAAFTKAVEQNPELYQQHKIERDQARRQAA